MQKTDDCVTEINEDLERVSQWAGGNGLGINPMKSKALVISRVCIDVSGVKKIKLNDSTIEFVNEARNLGVVFNRSLTWSNHINSLTGRVYGMLRTLCATQKFTPFKIRMLLAKSFLLPTLLYGCELYANCDSSDKSKLNKIFNNITRYVFCLRKFDHVSVFSVQIYSMSFDELLKFRVLLFLQKVVHGREPMYLYNKLTFLTSSRFINLKMIRYKYLISERQFLVSSVRLWNSLPNKLTFIKNPVHFRNELKIYMSAM